MNIIIESEKGKFTVDEIVVAPNIIPDFWRRLFKVTNDATGEEFFEGLSISRTNFTTEKNKGNSEKDLWEKMINDVLVKNILAGEKNVEIQVGDTYQVKRLNSEDGGYKN